MLRTHAPERQQEPHAAFILFGALPSRSTVSRVAAVGALSVTLFTAAPNFAAVAATLPQQQQIAEQDQKLDAEHSFSDEVWTLVNKYYIDPQFHGFDWGHERDRLSTMKFASHSDTYKALRASIARLDDRYTRILSPTDMESLRKFDVSGVGLLLTAGVKEGELVVATDPTAGSQAAKVGIRQGDVLEAIDGVKVAGAGAFDVAEMMQGDEGSSMVVKFRGREPVALTRHFSVSSSSEPSPVRFEMRVLDDGTRLGYVRLTEFRASGRGAVESALRTLSNDGAQAYMLDLRGNPGGVFEGALEIAGLFSGDGSAVARVSARTTSVGNGEEVYRSRVVGGGGAVVPSDAPVVVLVDGGSASSSEVLAGALRDNCRATLAGSRSYGKGLIQGVFGLSDGGGVVVTVAQYHTPSDAVIQGIGLTPAIPLRSNAFESAWRLLTLQEPSIPQIDINAVRRELRMCKENAG